MNNFIDNFEITDKIGPNGLVIIKDKDGNILVKKHNMVVKSGHKFVFDKVRGSGDYSDYNFYKIYFGASTTETQYLTSVVDKITITVTNDDDTSTSVEYYSYSFLDDSSLISFIDSDDHPYILISLSGIKCDPNKTSNLSCLSLTIKEDSSEEVLFSRICFDPIPMVTGNELTLEYYIYF